ncbi:MAG: phospholipase D-like domain-containing protein [Vulcanimicrobiota bacterium]
MQFGMLRRIEDFNEADGFETAFEPSDHLDKSENTKRALAILVDEDVITPDLLEDFAKSASKIKLDSSIKPSEWRAMARELREDGLLAPESMDSVREFAKDVRSLHSDLHRQFRDSGYEDKKISRELENVHVFLQHFEEPRKKYLEVASQVALEAVTGATFGPSAAVAAYVAWSQPTRQQVDDMLVQLEALETKKSPIVWAGNKVKGVHQEELWKAMNEMLDGAIESAKKGQPVEINAQYFELTSDEFIGKLAEAAQLGCKLRINIDPSRPGNGGMYGVSVDDGPRKMRALLQLASLPNADVGVSVYPVHKKLGSLSKLMHRKLLRVGDKVLLGGMNANKGSGENVDAGYIIEGPAARRLTEIFSRDVHDSMGAGSSEVFGDANVEKLMNGNVSLTAFGLAHLLDALAGASPAGTTLDADPSYATLEDLATKAGYDFPELVDLSQEELQTLVDNPSSRRKSLPLSDTGKEALAALSEKVFSVTNSEANNKKLDDISLPEGKVAGKTAVGIGDLPAEREALVLHAISEAEEFVYIPTFVITRAVARALAARQAELKAKGKTLDVKVIADAGIYSYGGTPNTHGVLALEDAGIDVRWSLLPRSTADHDRKIHAKQLITDKMEFFGSTNLSNKGLTDNWELSGLVMFDPDDPDSMATREQSKASFLKLWERESFSLDSRKVAEKRLEESVDVKDYAMRVEEARQSALKSLLSRIRQFELESAAWMQTQAQDPAVEKRRQDNLLAGMAEGYALLKAVEDTLGTDEFYAQLNKLDGMRSLRSLRRYG